jgi:hypothetical protein
MKAHHLTEEEIRQYWQRTLPPATLMAADDHLAQCTDCRKSVKRSGKLAGEAALLDALAGEEPPHSHHLTYDDLVAFVDDDSTAGDRPEILQHIRTCKDCADEVEDLTRLRADARERREANLGATIAGKRWPFWTSSAWAGAAAAVVLAALLGVRAYQNRVQPKPALVAQLNDAGGRIRLDSSGGLALPSSFSPGEAAQIKDALLARRIETSPAISQLISQKGTLLGETGPESGLQLIAPLGTMTPSDKPTFRWQPVSSATYVVSIYDAKYQKVAESPGIQQTVWASVRPLPRGQTYTWQLTALIKGKQLRAPVPPAPEARFQVLAQAEAEQLEEAQRQRANSHLLLGLLYARAGALDEAERELTTLLAANPDSRLAKDLLASVQQLRRR